MDSNMNSSLISIHIVKRASLLEKLSNSMAILAIFVFLLRGLIVFASEDRYFNDTEQQRCI